MAGALGSVLDFSREALQKSFGKQGKAALAQSARESKAQAKLEEKESKAVGALGVKCHRLVSALSQRFANTEKRMTKHLENLAEPLVKEFGEYKVQVETWLAEATKILAKVGKSEKCCPSDLSFGDEKTLNEEIKRAKSCLQEVSQAITQLNPPKPKPVKK